MYEPRSKIQRNYSLQYELDEKLMYVGHIDKAVGVVGGRVWLGRGGGKGVLDFSCPLSHHNGRQMGPITSRQNAFIKAV